MIQQATIHTTQVSLPALIKDYVTYNLWANRTIAEWLRTKPAPLMEQEIASSFPSISLTLLHIWSTQSWWLGNLECLHPESMYGKKFEGSFEEILNGLVRQSDEFHEYVHALKDEEWEELCDFSIPFVGDFLRPRFEMIQHCMNHSTYHRGQVITIGRQLGFTDAPMTDYMFYLLMAK